MNKIIQITAFILLSSILYGQAGSPLDIQFGATIQPENWNIDVKRSTKLGDGIGTDTTSIEGVHRIFWDTTGKSITIGHNILGNFGFALPHYGAIVLDTANDVTNILAITPIGIIANRAKDGLSKIMELTENSASLQLQFNDSVKGQVGIWDSTGAESEYVEATIIKNGVDVGGFKVMLHDTPSHTAIHMFLMDTFEVVRETEIHVHEQVLFENNIGYYFDAGDTSVFVADASAFVYLTPDGDTVRMLPIGSGNVIYQMIASNGGDFSITTGDSTFAGFDLSASPPELFLDKAGQDVLEISVGTLITGNLDLPYNTSNVTNPPTDAEIDAIFGTAAAAGDGFTARIKDSNSNNFYTVVAVGSAWYTFAATLAP